MPIYLLLPAICLFTGVFVADAGPMEYVAVRGIYFVCSVAMLAILQWPFSVARSYRRWAGLSPIHLRATWRALRPRSEKPRYKVTEKTPERLSVAQRVVAGLVILLTVVAIVYALVTRSLPLGTIWVNIIWGLFVIWTLLGICQAALQSRQPRGLPRPAV